jgi:hypothetical protein
MQEIILTIKLESLDKSKHVHIVNTLEYIKHDLLARKYAYSQLAPLLDNELSITYTEK